MPLPFSWKHALLLIAASVLVVAHVRAEVPTDSRFVAVFIDTKTENALGPFPYDRAVLAKAIDKAVESGARGVVLKLFIDKPRTVDGDRALVNAAKRTKLILQARIDNNEPTPNPLANRFALHMPIDGKMLSGKSGWLPLAD